MSLSTIRAFLAQDVIDSTAAAAVAANPQYNFTTATVPDYFYKSLGTLFLGSAPTCATLGNAIYFKKGENTGNAGSHIVLLSLPEDSYQNAEGSNNNSPGALDYYMEIIYKYPQGTSANDGFNKLLSSSMRVRKLLDLRWRDKQKSRPKWVIVKPPVDLSLQGGLMCFWLGFVNPPNGAEVVERWLVRQEIYTPFG